jgi:hypothetical protein
MNSLGASELLVIFMVVLILAAAVLIPYWKIFVKAGFSPWLSLLMFLPLVNIGLLYFLAFSDWPSLRKTQI